MNIRIPKNDLIGLIKQNPDIIQFYKEKYLKKCEFCGSQFFAIKKNQVCCNQKCSTAKYQRDNPERMKEIKREWARKNRKKSKLVVEVEG